MGRAWVGWQAWVLPALFLLVPFEPRGVLEVGGLRLTLLEGFALVAVVCGAPWSAAVGRLVLRQPPIFLAWTFAGAHVLSAVATDVAPARSFRFALRMVALAVLAVVVACASPTARLRSLAALAIGGFVVAALAIAEGQGLRAIDPLLAAFREQPFNVGGVRRASAGSEYPNLAAACLAYALVALAAGSALRFRPPVAGALRFTALPLAAGSAFLAAGLMATYSRGGLLAAALGLAAVWAALPRGRRFPAIALASLCLTAVAWSAGRELTALRVASEGVTSWYGAVYEPAERELRLVAGSRTRTPVRVTNTGQRTWTHDGSFRLSHHWYSPAGMVSRDGARTSLGRDVAPRETVVLQAEVLAPLVPGDYHLLWDMVQEDVAWFSGQGVPPARVAVRIEAATSAPAAKDTPPPLAPSGEALESAGWRPGRMELWKLALGMWREHPFLGVGSDNFRWLHGPRAGRGAGNTHVYANNLFLETAATTGLVGLAALVATLIAVARQVWHSARSTDVVEGALAAGWLGLLTVVVAHGMVDYILAFTGHYLVLGLLIGSAAGLAVARPATSR